MNLCVLTLNPDFSDLNGTESLARITKNLSPVETGQIFVLGHRWQRIRREDIFFSLLWGQESYRQNISRKVFCMIAKRHWFPRWLLVVPLRLCQREICENVLACDPDLVILDDSPSSFHVETLLRERFPRWRYVKGLSPDVLSNTNRRKYDPSLKVSIVLPTFNGVRYIQHSIQSCLSQTYGNIELIIVDDGSDEQLGRIVRRFQDSRIKYLKHESNLGLPAALNNGFRESTGQYLTWTSDDNLYVKDAIERMVRFLQTYSEVDFVYASQFIIDEGGKILKTLTARPPQWLDVNNGVGACFLYKRKVYEEIGDYNPATFLAEDYDYWVRVKKSFRMQRLFTPLYYYRRHRESLTEKCGPGRVASQAILVKKANRT